MTSTDDRILLDAVQSERCSIRWLQTWFSTLKVRIAPRMSDVYIRNHTHVFYLRPPAGWMACLSAAAIYLLMMMIVSLSHEW